MATQITAGPYVSRHVASAGNGQPTTVLYQGPSYSGPDARESVRHGMNVAGIKGKPVRQVAFAWGEDNVDVAAINHGPILGNPYADLYSVRDGKLVPTPNFCSRELGQLVEELDLTARLATHKTDPTTRQRLAGEQFTRNSCGAPLVVNKLATFPNGVDVRDYALQRTDALGLGGETGVAIVFAYGTNASGTFGPAADILAIRSEQPTPENPDFDLHTIVGEKVWQPAGICRFEVRRAAKLTSDLGEKLGSGRTFADLAKYFS